MVGISVHRVKVPSILTFLDAIWARRSTRANRKVHPAPPDSATEAMGNSLIRQGQSG